MRNKISLVLGFLLLLITVLSAQYDEKRIMLNQAQSFENLNQITRAQSVYEDLLKKYPADNEVIQRLLSVYFRTSAFDNVNSLLESKKSVLNQIIYVQNKVTYLVKTNDLNQAKKLADDFIKQNPQLINNYQSIATIFESNTLYDYAQEYYLAARKISNNDKLFAFELSNNYYQTRNFKGAISESVNFLSLNKGYMYFMSARFKEVVKTDSSMINTIREKCAHSEFEEIRELYALSLMELAYYDKALEIYESLSLDKFIKFADDLFSSGKTELSLRAYNIILLKNQDVVKNAEINLRIAQIYIQKQDLLLAKDYLNRVINTKELDDKRFMYKSRAHIEARELMANISIIENAQKETVLKYYDEAAKYSFNQADRNNLEYKKINYLIMKEDFRSANLILNKIISKEESGSVILAQSYYYQYLVFIMQEDSRADSLMTEYIINFPENPIINDMMFMSLFLSVIPKDSKAEFFKAYRLKNLYQNNEAIQILTNLVTTTKDDELTLLLGEWYIDIKNYSAAKEIFNRTFTNPVYNEYAKLSIIKLETESSIKSDIIRDYLKTTPNSVFSPLFRQLLLKQSIKS